MFAIDLAPQVPGPSAVHFESNSGRDCSGRVLSWLALPTPLRGAPTPTSAASRVCEQPQQKQKVRTGREAANCSVVKMRTSEPVRDKPLSDLGRRHFHQWAVPHAGNLTPARTTGVLGTGNASSPGPCLSQLQHAASALTVALCGADELTMRERAQKRKLPAGKVRGRR